jgi:hypothetical protein
MSHWNGLLWRRTKVFVIFMCYLYCCVYTAIIVRVRVTERVRFKVRDRISVGLRFRFKSRVRVLLIEFDRSAEIKIWCLILQ